MKNIKGILIGALTVPVLALTGGLAYASTTGGHPAQARPAATATTQNHAQYRAGPACHDWCAGRHGSHWCDWHGYGRQPQPAHQRSHQHPAYRHPSYRHAHGYRGYSTGGHQGGWSYGYQGSGYQGSWGNGGSGNYGGWGHSGASHWGNGGCCGGHGW
jgi:hypothetical protein